MNIANTKKNRLTALVVSICAIVALLAGATGVLAAKLQVTDIDISDETHLEHGSSETIEVVYSVEGDLPENLLQKAAKATPLCWASSNDAVVMVDAHGKITANAPGTAEISVSAHDGALTDSCTVIVTVSPESITAPEEITLTLNASATQSLGAALLPENTTAKVCYTSSDETVATVSETGEVTAISRGECMIRAWAEDTLSGVTYDLQSETKISVQAAPAQLSVNNATLQPGATKQLTVSFEPAEVDVGTDFSWTSSNASIATVDENGLVTAKSPGTTTITATNELGQSTICEVTVTGCSYCGSANHTTARCAKKAVEQRGALGRWRIPSVGVDVACFYGPIQANCDAADSACYWNAGSTIVVADHNYQGFNAIKKCNVGDIAYLDTGDGIQKYICTGKEIGTNKKECWDGVYSCTLRYADGTIVEFANRGGLICYTCNESYRSVTIVTFRPAN